MNAFKKVMATVATAGLLMASSMASAVPFTITAASFTPGSGYGIDTGFAEIVGGAKLDVRFSPSSFAPETFTLDSVGSSKSFTYGTVNFREFFISSNETNNLGVTASLDFTSPLDTLSTIKANGTAVVGFALGRLVDYRLDWAPITVDFGSGGRFVIDLADLSFTGIGSKTQNATITLIDLPGAGGGSTAVPEPSTVTLFGLGLLGFAASRRKAARKRAA